MPNLTPIQGGRGFGGPPEDTMLEKRVQALEERIGRIETKIDRIDSVLQRLEPVIRELALDNKDFRKQLADTNARLAGLEGQFKAMPTALHLFGALITTWAAGAAIVFTLVRFTK